MEESICVTLIMRIKKSTSVRIAKTGKFQLVKL